MFFTADLDSSCSGCFHQNSHNYKFDFKEFCSQNKVKKRGAKVLPKPKSISLDVS